MKRTLVLLILPALAMAQLRVSARNPRYFVLQSDTNVAVFLAGSHTWLNNVDGGESATYQNVPQFNWSGYLGFLSASGHNLVKYWCWENAWQSDLSNSTTYRASNIQPFKRTGPGTAEDGGPKWNLDSLDQAYFDRVRTRIDTLAGRGVYAVVMLFDGWAVTADKGFGFSGRPFKGHPFNSANNTQGIGFTDANGDNTQRLPSGGGSATILAYQVAYVKKLIDELNSRNNVLWEICNEANSTSEGWQRAIIDTIKSYELRKPKQHPINYSVEYPGGNNAELFALSSHNQSASPTTDYSAGVNNDTSRIIITDSDHICGECEDGTWVYKSFCNGVGAILYMDPWNGKDYPHMVSNYDSAASNWVSARKAMGQVVAIAKMANLIDMRPSPALASTGHCLSGGSKWIAYQPGTGAFTLNLSGASGSLRTKWLNTATGTMTDGTTVQGGSTQGFTPPFSGSAILFVYSDAAVPVQLTSFTGKWTREGMVCLKWRTASETNTFGFDVQRSLDRQTYTDIPGTFVKGQGTTVAPHDYAVIDSTPFRGSSYRLKQTDLDGAVKFSETIRLNVAEDSVDSRTPLTLEILQNYPNPFNPSTTITYALPRAAHIRLVIVDAAGRRVATLIDESQTAGRHSVVWKGMNNRGIHVASGVYICVLSAGQDVRTSKLLIVR